MAVVVSLSLWIWLFVSVLPPTASEGKPEKKTITAEPGQNVTLTCRAPNNNIKVVEWSEPGLEPEYVLLYRDKQSDPSLQHPSFVNRVDLQDRQMKDGDVSLSLKNVKINDTGTYECRVVRGGTNRRKRANLDGDPISIITLRVAPPGPTGGTTEDGGSAGLIVGLSVSALLLVAAVVGFLIYRRQQSQGSNQPNQKSPLPAPPDKEAEQQLV